MDESIELVVEVLQEAGFERLPKPLVVGGTTFDFDAAAKGTGVSHDLVVIAGPRSSSKRLVQLLRGLSRMLDRAQSLRPVTIVLLDDEVEGSTRLELERCARVLTVTGADPTTDEIRRAVAVLLPLRLPTTATQGRDPLAEVESALGAYLTEEHRSLIDAGRRGPEVVRETLRAYLDAAFEASESPGGGA